MAEVIVGALSAATAVLFGIVQWRLQRKSELETRVIEAKKPFLERQLQLYTEATRTAAVLATCEDADSMNQARRRFWELYWGELALVENHDVESAMENFGADLKAGAKPDALARRSLDLAHACRVSLDRAWGIRAWTEGHKIQARSKLP